MQLTVGKGWLGMITPLTGNGSCSGRGDDNDDLIDKISANEL